MGLEPGATGEEDPRPPTILTRTDPRPSALELVERDDTAETAKTSSSSIGGDGDSDVRAERPGAGGEEEREHGEHRSSASIGGGGQELEGRRE